MRRHRERQEIREQISRNRIQERNEQKQQEKMNAIVLKTGLEYTQTLSDDGTKILNQETGKMVSITGSVGKLVLSRIAKYQAIQAIQVIH